jgi:hypothetical protein
MQKISGLKCINCGWPGLTRTEARRQYGRMLGGGLTAEAAKKLSPRCYRCTTSLLHPVGEVGEVGDP